MPTSAVARCTVSYRGNGLLATIQSSRVRLEGIYLKGLSLVFPRSLLRFPSSLGAGHQNSSHALVAGARTSEQDLRPPERAR